MTQAPARNVGVLDLVAPAGGGGLDERLLPLVLEAVDTLVVVLDHQGRVVAFNRACEELSGYGADQVRGRHFWEIFVPGRRAEQARAWVARWSTDVTPSLVERDFVTRDGSRVRIAWTARRLDGAHGAAGLVVAAGRDVTEEREAARRLRESERRLRTAYEVAGHHGVGSDAQVHEALEVAVAALDMEVGYVARVEGSSMRLESVVDPTGRLLVGQRVGSPDEWSDDWGDDWGDLTEPDHVVVPAAATTHSTDVIPVAGGCSGPTGLRTSIGVPLVADGRPFGTLCLASRSVRERPLDDTDRDFVGLLAGWMQRILEQRDLTERSRDLRERLGFAFEGAATAMALTDPTGRVLHANDALGRMLAVAPAALRGQPLRALVTFEDQEAVDRVVRRLLDGHEASYRGEHRLQLAERGTRWARLGIGVLRDDGGHPSALAYQVEDVSERRQVEERLASTALYDRLTGLPNRTLLLDRLHHALQRARRSGMGVGMLILGLDRFTLVNESTDHEVGDRVLQQVAGRLSGALRPSDTVARIAGDEFAVLCEDLLSSTNAVMLGDRLRTAIRAPIRVGDRDVVLDASVGVAAVKPAETATDAALLLRDASAAMGQAKQRGGGRYQVFDATLRHRAAERLDLEQDVRRALDTDEFEVWYQPQYDLGSGAIVGAEALVRWRHPQRGVLAPGAFLEMTEQTGLIVPLGDIVLAQACAQLATWSRAGYRLTVSVNLSVRQLSLPRFGRRVRAIVQAHHAPVPSMCFELTESMLMETQGMAADQLEDLSEFGASIAIDDFGTGYASLTSLTAHPIDVVKIDRSFVAGAGRRPRERAVIDAVASMSRTLGLRTVAEGAETAEHVALLREARCDRVQGYHLARPMPAPDLTALLVAAQG